MSAMLTGTKSAPVTSQLRALLGVADAALAGKLERELERISSGGQTVVVTRLAQVREQLGETNPRVILLDESLLEGAPLVELLRQMTETAPVILLGNAEWREDFSHMVAEGDVDFVARTGDFVPLVAGLIERRLRWAERSETALGPPWAGLPADSAEILRHEINNPLTGILGNAELLLGHRDRLPAADTQRLQTVVSLSVRLRETIRRLSNAWESQPAPLKSL
jgi:signal transduction histidine kinase